MATGLGFCANCGTPRTAAEQRVELHDLPPLPFVTHPEALARVPEARPMEEEKEIVPFGTVFAVQ